MEEEPLPGVDGCEEGGALGGGVEDQTLCACVFVRMCVLSPVPAISSMTDNDRWVNPTHLHL